MCAAMKGYSQKNYHIGDGTLYSVMVPLQLRHSNLGRHQQTRGPGLQSLTSTYRGSTPGRGRGKIRGQSDLSSHSAVQKGRKFKFHHQALPAEYLEHYTKRVASTSNTTDCSSGGLNERTVAGPLLSTSAKSSLEALLMSQKPLENSTSPNTPVKSDVPPTEQTVEHRGTRRKGRGRGSRAIPGFIQEVHESMAGRRRRRIIVERSSFPGEERYACRQMLSNGRIINSSSGSIGGTDHSGGRLPSELLGSTLSKLDDSLLWTSPVSSLLQSVEEGKSGVLVDHSPSANVNTELLHRLYLLNRQLRAEQDSFNQNSAGAEYLQCNSDGGNSAEQRSTIEPLNLCIRDSDASKEKTTTQPVEHNVSQFLPSSPFLLAACGQRKRGRTVQKCARRKYLAVPDVSIRKFKFRGGSAPSLQEKKSLVLDAEGPFRFFHNERLQCPVRLAGSGATTT